MSSRKALRFGMVGGGPGAFIGAVHNRAATVDGLATLVAGAFSSDAAKSREQGDVYRLAPERVYASFGEMAEREAALPKDVRIDFVSIVTPNHLHFPVAKAFVERGFHVVCDKPLTTTLEDAEELCRLVKKHDGWRTDPARAGAGAIGDIGTHAEHLARYVTGLEMEELFADVSTFVPGRRIDDDANMLVHYTGGAKGMLSCSQIAVGEENRLTIRVYGTTGSLEWKQEDPNFLYVRHADRPMEVYKPGHAQLVRAAQHGMRMPAGHPEGLLEAFANIYGSALRVMAARRDGDAPDPLDLDFPTVRDGATGVHFIQSALESGRKRDWVDAAYSAPE